MLRDPAAGIGLDVRALIVGEILNASRRSTREIDKLVRGTTKDYGCEGNPSTREVFDAARTRGLEYCPVLAAPALLSLATLREDSDRYVLGIDQNAYPGTLLAVERRSGKNALLVWRDIRPGQHWHSLTQWIFGISE
jgi:hypothetical protein